MVEKVKYSEKNGKTAYIIQLRKEQSMVYWNKKKLNNKKHGDKLKLLKILRKNKHNKAK